MASDLEKKIIRQVEYYFGDINLPRDKFLQETIKEDEGWVTIEVLLKFKRLASLSTDPEVIAAAVEKSEDKLVEVSEDKKKIRRNPECSVPDWDDERKKELMVRTAYAKGFPLDEDLNDILNFLEDYGPIESCIRRSTKDRKFKGSCFVIFKDVETCKKFVDAESLKYKETELIRKWQKDYLEGVKKELQERKQAKKNKKADVVEKKQEKTLEFPKGAVVYFTGLEEGQTLTREELKEKFREVGGVELAFIDFSKGDLEGHARFAEENAGVEFIKKLTDGEMEVDKFKLQLRVLEGEEEEAYLKKTANDVSTKRKQHKQSKNNRKRKGNFGNHDRDSKNRKRN